MSSKSNIKKITFILLFVTAIAAALAAVWLFVPIKKAHAEGVWVADGGWDVTTEDGITAYVKKSDYFGGAPQITYDQSVDFNTLEFTAQMNAIGAGECNLGATIYLENGYSYFMELCHQADYIIRMRSFAPNEEWLLPIPNSPVQFELNVDFTLKFVFDNDYLEILVNGQSAKRHLDTVDDFKVTKIVISSWNALVTVKDIKTYETPLENVWVADDGFTQTTDGTGVTYAKKETDGSSAIVHYGNVDFNTVELTATVAEIFENDVESNLGLAVTLANGKVYFLEVNYGHSSIRFRETSNGDTWLGFGTDAYTYTAGMTQNVKFVFAKDYLEVLLDGKSAGRVLDTQTDTFEVTKVNLSAWRSKVTVTDIKTSVGDTRLPFEWDAGNWAQSGGEYTAPNDEIVTMTHLGEFDGNTIEFGARPNGYRWSDAGFGVIFRCNGGETDWYLEHYKNNRGGHVRVRRNGTNLGSADFEIPTNAFTAFKVIFDEDYIVFYADGTRLITVFDTQGDVFDNRVIFNGWGVAPTVKDIVVSRSEKDYAVAGYLDYEFSDNRADASLTVNNGSARVTDGQFVWTIEGNTPTVSSAVIDVPRGTKYSALLTVRNTLLVRMKNSTSAHSVKVYFVTSEDGNYNDAKSKTFAIEPNGDYATYYFNLSDVIGCVGFLRGFKFEFIGAVSGEIAFDAITIERENAIIDYAGAIDECTATDKIVTVKGTLDTAFAGKKIAVATTPVNNYTDDPTFNGPAYGDPSHLEVAPIWTGTVGADGKFTAEFDFQNGTVTHLTSKFLAYTEDGKLVAPSFKITNYRDFTENPYAFKLNDLTVDVTDARFGAKGDGFTNDNGAIQSAIDYVSAQGGGTVRLVGAPEDPYGKRYVATHIVLKDNIELRIEEGAVLWQSQRSEDYDYKVTYGHDVEIEGLVWCHAGSTVNYPLVYAANVKNVRVTGGGIIRMMDTGGEQPDGYHYEWSTDGTPNIIIGCANTIHVIPIMFYKCENAEYSDMTVLRTNIWHSTYAYSKNIYVANIDEREAECINGDGYGIFGSKNVVIDRCYLYSNDDAITLTCAYQDGRGFLFYPSTPGEDHCVENIVIRHSNLFGGLGITFIPWGSEDPDLSKEEIKNIEVYDNIIGGTSRSVGSWPDNPFYGWSSLYDYNLENGETDDYSPVKDVYFHNNIYRNAVNIGVVKITNCISDCGLTSSDRFLNASFERELRYANETEFVSGLSYWSSKTDVGGEVGTEKIGAKVSQIKYPTSGSTVTFATVGDYAGYIKGNGELYQGLHLTVGSYEFAINAKLISGNAKLFARNAVSGEIIAEQAIAASESFAPVKLALYVSKGTTVQLGVMHEGDEDQIVYIDDATVTLSFNPDMFDIDGEKRIWGFDDSHGFVSYNSLGAGVTVSNGMLTVDDRAEYKIMLDQTGALKEFDLSVDIIPFGNINAGLYLLATEVKHASDMITAYNVQVEYNPDNGYYVVRLHSFSANTGYIGNLTESEHIQYSGGNITLRAVVKFNTLFVFTDHSDEYLFAYELPDGYEGGNVGLRSQYRTTHFDNLMLTTAQFAEGAGVRTELDKTLALADKFVESMYTAESFAALKSAIAEAAALGENAKQDEIDGVNAKLNAAIYGLQKADIKPVDPSTPDTPNTPNTPEPETVVVYDKDVGMTVGFYILLGLLIAGIAAAVAFVIISKKKAKKNN